MVASVGKFGGALVGGRLGGLNRRESLALATGLNARGSTEVIIASIGLSMGALSNQLYTMIVAMAVVTTMIMPPTLRWMMARVPLRDEEAKRLEKEEAEQTRACPRWSGRWSMSTTAPMAGWPRRWPACLRPASRC